MNRPQHAVEIGLGLQGDKRPGDYARLAVLAESHGFDVLSVFGDLMFQPPLVPLLEMAAVTGRVRLGAACWNPFSLHPYEIAGQVAALDLASDGRAYLGLARGSWLDRVGIGQPRPVAAVTEAARVVAALLSGDDRGFDGVVFRLAPGSRLRYPVRRPKVDLLIGAWGPRMAAVAGRIADEIKIGGTANPEVVGLLRERVSVGTGPAGRAPDDVGIVVGAVTVVDTDATAARRRARAEVAMYLDVVAGLDPTVDVPPELLAEIGRRVRLGDDQGAGDLITDELLDRFAFSGTPDQVAAQAQKLIDAGVSRVEFGTPHGLTDVGGIELLGSRVLPQLDRERRIAPAESIFGA
ncbi:MAG: 5,10-methylenetetrahydromethanopterin reductase [Amycolatopsis sp.]|uniref:LLM class flavin-dependent oxidoreductase n=1 Tax=Amycolatopsis sp. TaxID=37632 RepID=UPI002609A475|nr:LLM class flavin-dependent oxidoreductase [Amycolatopsis sp.]MCU1684165.1 5,10-methylenetetrahydromethanopterin reductase [Amycolatopsis sp.]